MALVWFLVVLQILSCFTQWNQPHECMVTDYWACSWIEKPVSWTSRLTNLRPFITLFKTGLIRPRVNRKKIKKSGNARSHLIWVELCDKWPGVIDILNNAIKYLPDGGRIKVGMRTTDAQLIISISDEAWEFPRKTCLAFLIVYRVISKCSQTVIWPS